ncbi:MAG: glycerophosphodiester phosphodiesterase [Candidatus Aenigmarchaeota archaeon]|nr:glycerophosphodiester phosphodiesterase [Candidatus Aenigmarchaeota archaeon]
MTVEADFEDVIGEGLKLFRKQYVAIIIAMIIAAFGSIFIITAPPLFFGLYLMGVKMAKGETVEVKDVFRGFDYFLVSWVLVIVAAITIMIGFIFFVIPGILLIILFQYAIPIAISEKLGAIDSLKKSYRIGRDNFWFTVILAIALWIIKAAGGAIVVGGLITFPFSIVCLCVATLRLTKGKKDKRENKMAE